ncbi:Hypothetical protein FKW44_015660, partial [Caligus rogercresseyi]
FCFRQRILRQRYSLGHSVADTYIFNHRCFRCGNKSCTSETSRGNNQTPVFFATNNDN